MATPALTPTSPRRRRRPARSGGAAPPTPPPRHHRARRRREGHRQARGLAAGSPDRDPYVASSPHTERVDRRGMRMDNLRCW